MSDAAARPAHRRAAVAFVFVTVMLDMLALGIIVPVFPKLVEGFVGGDAAKGATVFGLFGTVWNLMQFLFSPVLGALSDRFGRRRVILLSNLGLGLDYVLMALSPNLAWLFVGRVVSGITAASYTTASAYIADVTPPERRAAGFGILGAAFGLGFILGPAAGGLLGTVDPRLPFWGAAALSLANAGYGFFVLPESLPPERRSGFTWRKASPLGCARPAALAARAAGPRRRLFPVPARLPGAAQHLRPLHDRPLRLGPGGGRADAGADRGGVDRRAGRARAADRGVAGRAAGAAPGPRRRDRGQRHLRARLHRPRLLARHPADGVRRPVQPRGAGPDDPAASARPSRAGCRVR